MDMVKRKEFSFKLFQQFVIFSPQGYQERFASLPCPHHHHPKTGHHLDKWKQLSTNKKGATLLLSNNTLNSNNSCV
jgi:hypothetical protein